MVKEFYTLEKAASRLNVSLRTIHNYLKKGMLTRVSQENRVMVPASEVEDLVVESSFPTMNRANWIDINSRLRRLEERMSIVSTILGLHNEPLRPSRENASDLHIQAKKASTLDSWDSREIDMWIGILGRIDEITLTTIATTVADAQPWFTYTSLCQSLLDYVERKYKEEKTILLEKQAAALEDCKNRLRSVSVVWIETNRGSLSDIVLKAMVPSRQSGRTSSG